MSQVLLIVYTYQDMFLFTVADYCLISHRYIIISVGKFRYHTETSCMKVSDFIILADINYSAYLRQFNISVQLWSQKRYADMIPLILRLVRFDGVC